MLDGDSEQIVALLGGDLTQPHQYIRLAEAIAELGRDDEVLRWCREGIERTSGWQTAQLYDLACEVHTRREEPLEGGEVAWIDGLRFVVHNRTIHAGFNRRYCHRRRGVTVLTTTADNHATLHTVVVPGTQPDALYLLDGLLGLHTSVRPREVMTDTAGCTDVVFGLFRLLTGP